MTELEPFLERIELLTPHLGRAGDDLKALVTRGRNRDYKGVLQNARLVLEMLLRSLVTTELKQTPGKAMLDELINKFRQQAHAGLIPPHILGHMGTVQAWGNLSSHDHAGGLHEQGTQVGLQEALTSLNSLVAILAWYKDRFVQEPAAPAPASPGDAPAPVVGVRPSGGRRMALVGGVALVALVAGLGVISKPGVPSSAVDPRGGLDALYVESGEPLPPADCQETDPRVLEVLLDVAPKLSERVSEAAKVREANTALAELRARGQDWRPEGWFHVARASLLAGSPDMVAMNSALLCEGFAAAENLAGRMRVARDVKESAAHFTRAMKLAPRFWRPAFNLGLIHLQQQDVDEAVRLLERAAELAPRAGEAHLFLGHAYKARARAAEASGRGQEAVADHARARDAFCLAKSRGHPQAASLCAP